MRSLSILTAGFLILAGASNLAAQADGSPRFGYIDSQAILQQLPAAQAAQQEFNQELQSYRDEVAQMEQRLDSMMQAYEQQRATLSAEERQRRETAIRQQQQEYQQRVQQLDQQAGQRQAELVQPIMNEINAVIEQIRREGDYDLIFDAAAGSILAANPSLDLTAQVIERLQADTGAEGGAPGGSLR